ncbi:sensor histidine kinase [Soonwooa sp.]|uniref:sensor histidine kinase n=1 Tax=Soonwooa sp. TaxID=1938592 RepID=UPI0035B06C5E
MKKIIPKIYIIPKIFGLCFLLSFIFIDANDKNPIQYSHQLIRQNKIDSAIVYINQHISKSKSEISKAFLYVELGNAYKLKQEYEKSPEAYKNALRIFKQKKLLQEEFYVYTHLAEFYRYRRLFKKAEEYFSICENILRNHKIKDLYLIKYYNRKAALFSKYKVNSDSVLIYSQKSLVLSRELKDSENELISMMEIANIYEGRKNYRKAIEQLQQVINLARRNSNIQLQSDAMINLSRNLDLTKDYTASINVGIAGYNLSEANKLNYNQLVFADHLQNVYEKTGDYQQAHKYLRIRLNLTEDYYHKLYDSKVLEYEERFKIAEKEKTIEENKKLLLLKEEEIKRQNLLKYAILFGLIAILIFTVILLNYVKIITKQNKKLTVVSQQNEFLVSETHHRINNNLQLVRILIDNELKKNSNDDLSNKRIIAKIDSLGILHRQLYDNQDKKNLNLKSFLLEIKQNLDFLFVENHIKVKFDVKDLVIPVNSAMYIGLLVTELCMNSMKHAFPNQDNKNIDLKIDTDESKIYFQYEDNGEAKNEITKLNLVEKLCRQLKIEYRIDLENGFKFSFNMKL